jgi:UDP-N-acetylglucosamine 3-dehydrogenase
MLRIAVIGAGAMGRNHVRILAGLPGIDFVGVVDPGIDASHPHVAAHGVPVFASVDDLPPVDAAVIATPTRYHYATGVELLGRGVHLLVEKPLALDAIEAAEMVRLARDKGVTLAVGHVERFNAAFGSLKALCREPKMISFERLSPFTARIADSVVTDLMIHDLDLAMWILEGYPTHVQAVGVPVFSDALDVASAALRFPSGCIVTLQASRITQDKVRRVSISEPDRFIVADSMRQDVMIKRETAVVFSDDEGPQVYRQANTVEVPYLDRSGEPLVRELEDFLSAVRDRRDPLVSGDDGLRAVRLAREIEDLIHG